MQLAEDVNSIMDLNIHPLQGILRDQRRAMEPFCAPGEDAQRAVHSYCRPQPKAGAGVALPMTT